MNKINVLLLSTEKRNINNLEKKVIKLLSAQTWREKIMNGVVFFFLPSINDKDLIIVTSQIAILLF